MTQQETTRQIAQLRTELRENRRKLGNLLMKAEALEGECDQARAALVATKAIDPKPTLEQSGR